MFSSNSQGYSLSDIAAATGSNNNGNRGGWGDDYWWIIILFLVCGWGNGFGGGYGGGGALTRADLCQDMNFSDLENGVRSLQSGLCDGFYAMNTGMLNGFAGVQSALCQGFSGVNNAITQASINNMQDTFGLQTAITAGNTALTAQLTNMAAQQASCCCNTQRQIERGFCDLNYNLASQSCDTRRAIADSTRDIIDSNNSGVRAILDFLTQDKIASLTAENQTLKFTASQQAQNTYLVNALREPNPVPAFVVPNPNTPYPYYGYGFGSGCGCCNAA